MPARALFRKQLCRGEYAANARTPCCLRTWCRYKGGVEGEVLLGGKLEELSG
jgi:hypothetical protein